MSKTLRAMIPGGGWKIHWENGAVSPLVAWAAFEDENGEVNIYPCATDADGNIEMGLFAGMLHHDDEESPHDYEESP